MLSARTGLLPRASSRRRRAEDMVPQPSEAAVARQPSEEIPLSGPALADFLQAVMKEGISFAFRVSGTSMFPFIRVGDVVTVSP